MRDVCLMLISGIFRLDLIVVLPFLPKSLIIELSLSFRNLGDHMRTRDVEDYDKHVSRIHPEVDRLS